MSAQLTPLSQEAAEEEAIAALGKARTAYDEAWAEVDDLRALLRRADAVASKATEQYFAAKSHFHAVSRRSTEGL